MTRDSTLVKVVERGESTRADGRSCFSEINKRRASQFFMREFKAWL